MGVYLPPVLGNPIIQAFLCGTIVDASKMHSETYSFVQQNYLAALRIWVSYSTYYLLFVEARTHPEIGTRTPSFSSWMFYLFKQWLVEYS